MPGQDPAMNWDGRSYPWRCRRGDSCLVRDLGSGGLHGASQLNCRKPVLCTTVFYSFLWLLILLIFSKLDEVWRVLLNIGVYVCQGLYVNYNPFKSCDREITCTLYIIYCNSTKMLSLTAHFSTVPDEWKFVLIFHSQMWCHCLFLIPSACLWDSFYELQNQSISRIRSEGSHFHSR